MKIAADHWIILGSLREQTLSKLFSGETLMILCFKIELTLFFERIMRCKTCRPAPKISGMELFLAELVSQAYDN